MGDAVENPSTSKSGIALPLEPAPSLTFLTTNADACHERGRQDNQPRWHFPPNEG
jgi:hypothetical protein